MNKPSEKTREDQPSKKTREDLLLENIELHRENRLLKNNISTFKVGLEYVLNNYILDYFF